MNRFFSLRFAVFFIIVFLSFFPFLRSYNSILNNIITLLLFCLFLVIGIVTKKQLLLGNFDYGWLFFFFVWAAFSFFSYSTAKNEAIVIPYSLLLLTYPVVFFISNQFTNYNQKYKYILILAIILSLAYVIISLWEVTTIKHFFTSRYYNELNYIPTGPFYNQNSFASVLTMIFPFILFSNKIFSNFFIRMLTILISFMVVIIIIIQSARLAMLFIAFNLIIYFLFFTTLKQKLIMLVIIFILIQTFINIYPKEAEITKKAMYYSFESLSSESKTVGYSSLKVRMALFFHYFDIAKNTYLLGGGTGNFPYRMQSWRKQSTYGDLDAHNYIMEMLANNGIIVFLFFLSLYIALLFKLFFIYRKESNVKKKYFFFALFLSIFNYLAANFLPGSLAYYTFHWFLFGVAANVVRNTQLEKN